MCENTKISHGNHHLHETGTCKFIQDLKCHETGACKFTRDVKCHNTGACKFMRDVKCHDTDACSFTRDVKCHGTSHLHGDMWSWARGHVRTKESLHKPHDDAVA